MSTLHDAVDDLASGSIIALIPAYNAGPFVHEVVRKARQHLPVLVVNDGSLDDTAHKAETAGAILLNQLPNQGKGAALQLGFRWALEHGATAVLALDADGQHDPAEIPKFIAKFRQTGADLIIGERDFSQMPLVRRVSNSLARKSFSWAMGQEVRDNQSGYRLLSRRLLEAVLASDEQGFEFEMDMIVTVVRNHWKLDWVPIRTIYADEVSNIKPLQHAAHFFRMVWSARRQLRAA